MSFSRTRPPKAAATDLQCFADVLCLGCGCLCDDLEIMLKRGVLVQSSPACNMGAAWFTRGLSNHALATSCRVKGQDASLDEATAAAASILANATYPLVYGLSRGANETAAAAVACAEQLGAALDVSLKPFERALILAQQNIGDRTATLGFVRNHATRVVFWGCDPLASHPRHLERYTGMGGKSLITVGSQSTATTRHAVRHFQILPGSAYHAILALWSIAQATPVDERKIESATGLRMDQWRTLHEMIVQSPLTAIFLGSADCGSTLGECIVFCTAALQWGAAINRISRVVTLALGDGYNASGAVDTLTWQTGFPFALDFSAGFPQFDPDRFAVDRLLAANAVDAALVVDAADDLGDDPQRHEAWAKLPCVVVGPELPGFVPAPDVWIPTATTSLDAAGTVHRSDRVAWRTRPMVQAIRPTSAAAIGQILGRFGLRS